MKLTKLLLCLLLLLSSFGCTFKKQEVIEDVRTGQTVEYKHYDTTDFYNQLDKLESLIETDSIDEELALYDKLYEELLYILDLSCSSYVEYCKDYTNEYYAEESLTSENDADLAQDAFCTVAQKIALSKDADKLKEHLNDDVMFNSFVEYNSYSDELIDLLTKESTLVNDYSSLDYYSDTYTFDATGIFYELVSIRNRIAELNGYDNFAEYADKEIYFRDYTSDQLKEFYRAVKDCNLDKLKTLYLRADKVKPDYNVNSVEAMEDLTQIVSGMGESLNEAYNFMTTNNLIYLTDDINSLDTGYTLLYYSTNTPYIYNNLLGEFADVYYNLHEFGHFANYYYCLPTNALFNEESIELCEIHSTGLELLSNSKVMELLNYSNQYGYNYRILDDFIYCILAGCLYDEWQRTIYENKDMTIEEMDELYIELCYEYSLDNYYDELSMNWTNLIHNFTDPMYYISYALSAFTSCEIWLDSNTDYDNAMDLYEKIVKTSPFEKTYVDVIEEYDFTKFYNYDEALQTLDSVIDACNIKI